MIVNLSAGGADLNFKVIGSIESPASPAENTVWVNTDVPVSRWTFDIRQPDDPAIGDVWISDGFSNECSFNALKKNALIVHPQQAMQYTSSGWQNRTVKVYQNGAWVDINPFYYSYGQYGEPMSAVGIVTQEGLTFSEHADHIRMVVVSDHVSTFCTVDKVEIKTNTLKCITGTKTKTACLFIANVRNPNLAGSGPWVAQAMITQSGEGIVTTLDVSSYVGASYYVGVANGLGGTLDVYKVWAE